ncbi:efflux RND transporter periplasmic adaptor subunit [Bradyrhizobium sp.]|uniref:HlyD family secretion protein n=1 Tax=Bradyrhizobium sp. TaxID=376 RepID=UPI00238F75C5|nr:efflux RND transporter periplasmic adaptor subunit [Bradyrhizobium sp.]MDE2380061.1 efflux RND transporter periplasmic adaptor subunit [Bradyrhizobium sp.]
MRGPAVFAIAAVLTLATGGYVYWTHMKAALTPEGLASANGRIEVTRVDIASKLPGRVAQVRVREGDAVRKGDLIAELDTAELRAQLAGAKAAVQRAVAAIARAEADIAIRKAERDLAEAEMQRALHLEQTSSGTKADLDRRRAQSLVAAAQIEGSRAALVEANAAREAADAQVAQIEAMLDDSELHSPVNGRVEYRLVQPGEVVAAGGRLVTILDLSDVYMTVFLPTGQSGRVALGSQARIVLDSVPDAVFPATVSFVAAEAQFTPKTVETQNGRQKLMYRVKLAIDAKLLETYRDYVKAGLTGNAYVQVMPNAVWPAALSVRLPDVAG